MTFCRTGNLALTASWDGNAILWDTPWQLIHSLTSTSRLHLRAGFSQDGRQVLTANRDGTGRVWDVASARRCAG
jgi:WD40 repeat protein